MDIMQPKHKLLVQKKLIVHNSKFEKLMTFLGAANFIKVRYKSTLYNCDNWLHDKINCSSQKRDR